MTDRLNPEALRTVADVILHHCGGYVDTTPADAERAAKAVLHNLAALPAPRTITTVEELDALPMWSYVQGHDGFKHTKNEEGDWNFVFAYSGSPHSSADIATPALVLWMPTEGGGESTNL